MPVEAQEAHRDEKSDEQKPMSGSWVGIPMRASKSPHLTQTNMVSTLRPVPSLICWQIRCLVVIPAGEGLHEGACAIRVGLV